MTGQTPPRPEATPPDERHRSVLPALSAGWQRAIDEAHGITPSWPEPASRGPFQQIEHWEPTAGPIAEA